MEAMHRARVMALEKSRKEIKYELERAFCRLIQTEALGDEKEIRSVKRKIRLYEEALLFQLRQTANKITIPKDG